MAGAIKVVVIAVCSIERSYPLLAGAIKVVLLYALLREVLSFIGGSNKGCIAVCSISWPTLNEPFFFTAEHVYSSDTVLLVLTDFSATGYLL